MSKISVTIDVDKIDKSKITSRTYKDQEGKEVTVREYRMDVVPLKEEKFVKDGDTWVMVKTHFVAEAQTKEERDAGAETTFLGSGITFREKSQVQQAHDNLGYGDGADDEVPF